MIESKAIPKYVEWFRHSSPYIHAHRAKVFVLSLVGVAVADKNFETIVHDIALLSSLGVKLVLVHGSAAENPVQTLDAAELEELIKAVSLTRSKIEARLSMGLINTPMHGAQIRLVTGNFICAQPAGIKAGVDLGHVGQVRRVDADAIKQQLELDNIVLISELGYSPSGEVFQQDLAQLSMEVAASLQADKLIMFGSDFSYIGQSELTIEQIQNINNPCTLLQAAIVAAEAGVSRCHLLSYKENGALLSELFTREGSGVMLMKSSYEQVRPAQVEDVGALLQLLEPLEQEGVLVRRSRELLENELKYFVLIERDRAIIGCAALYPFAEEHKAELACVAVAPEYRGQARGDRLLAAIEHQAKDQGLKQLFVLTTQTAHWFLERGFEQDSTNSLPNKKQVLYNWQRQSKVFIKSL